MLRLGTKNIKFTQNNQKITRDISDENVLSIFKKNLNNKNKLIPFNIIKNTTGETKYFPPASKEWTNNVYFFNKNTTKNLPVIDINLFDIINNYFNAFFNQDFIYDKKRYHRKKSLLTKIFVSKPEIKHTNSKALVTVYTYNIQGISLFSKVKKLILLKKKLYDLIFNLLLFKKRNGFLNKQYKLNQALNLTRRLKLKLNLNKLKFEEKLLYKLTKLISKFYNKKIEFNIVNLKSVMLNTDFFTEILAYKLKDIDSDPITFMNIILNEASLSIKDTSRVIKYGIGNKLKNMGAYANNNLQDICGTTSSTPTNYKDKATKDKAIYDTIFKSIKYKNTRGVRLEVKGRLTKRYRSDRAIYNLRWKGGLKNKGLSFVNFRGFIVPNIQYSINTAKRRIGAFAVKGWINGK